MNILPDPADQKLVTEVKETVKRESHTAAVEAVKEAKEAVAKEEKAKK